MARDDCDNRSILEQIEGRAAAADQQEGNVSRDIEDLRREGWLTACLPCELGGEGWGCEANSTIAAFDALRNLGRANLSVARLFEGHMNAVKLVVLYGSGTARERLGAAVLNGALLGVWGADDRACPLSYGMETRSGQHRIKLSGAKMFASGLGLVSKAIVTAGGEDGERLLLVPVDEEERGDPATWNMGGMRATQSGRYDFTGLVLGSGASIGNAGDYFVEPHFEGGIWRYCAAHLGAAERLYDEMLGALTASDRAQDPHQQKRITDAAIAIETARLWLVRAAREIEACDADAHKAALALLAREVTHDACRKVITLSEAALGMAAHIAGSPVERIRRDLGLFLCQAAPDAKRARAAQVLVARKIRPEHL
ncbi:MAG: acyl-CoA dehydrogenase family protein [Erythrobacter sp.]